MRQRRSWQAPLFLTKAICGHGLTRRERDVFAEAGCSAVLALAGCAVFEGGLQLEHTTGIAWLIILYLAVTCTFAGYLMQNLALTKISERTVALLQSLCPVMTAVFSLLLLGETLSPAGIIGALIHPPPVAAGSASGEELRTKVEGHTTSGGRSNW